MNPKIQKLINTVKTKYIQFTLFFLGYILLEVLINDIQTLLPSVFLSYPTWYAISFVSLNLLIIPTLVSLTLTISIEKIKDIRSVSPKKGIIPMIATFGGLLGGACPGCFVGLFPAFVGLFGSTLTLANLPLYGIEIQLASGLILIISLNYLTRDTVCKMPSL